MKRLLILAVLPLTGCLPISLIKEHTPIKPKVVCVASYEEIVPGGSVGRDGCGNSWMRIEDRCAYWDKEDGVVIEFACPAEGDTLYVEP